MLASHASRVNPATVHMVPPWMLTGVGDCTVAAACVFALFVIQWSFTSPWWKDKIGSTFALKDIVLLGILVPASVMVFDPDAIDPYSVGMIDMCVLGGATLVMCWRIVVFWREKMPWPARRLLDWARRRR